MVQTPQTQTPTTLCKANPMLLLRRLLISGLLYMGNDSFPNYREMETLCLLIFRLQLSEATREGSERSAGLSLVGMGSKNRALASTCPVASASASLPQSDPAGRGPHTSCISFLTFAGVGVRWATEILWSASLSAPHGPLLDQETEQLLSQC